MAPKGASARERGSERASALSRRERALLVERCRAALEVRKAAGLGGEPGCATLEALPWLAEVEPVALARVVLQVHLPDAAPTISVERHRQLVAAMRRLDRYADLGRGRRGAGAEQLLNVVRGDWRDQWHRPPKSLGGVAVSVRRLANDWRRHHKTRRRSQGAAA